MLVSSHHLDGDWNNGSTGPAVLVRNAIKSYGTGEKRSSVLAGFDMNVQRGTIYGLLGSSGCGKTTLLSCLVGRRSLNSGEVLVFGNKPGTPESGIPGPRVGYMPQELALYGDFTIKETLQYFGRIYSLPKAFVKEQLAFLSKLLDLPPSDRYVKTLSGGQKRRVSFAVALFHEPELLILDEPTVGVDPLLRRSIWDHLIRQSVDHGKTVIVTTHYIEEARQANTIGMMRSGRLLAEQSPEMLLSHYRLSSLEDVFLKLCMEGSGNHPADQFNEPVSIITPSDEINHAVGLRQRSVEGHDNPSFDRNNRIDVSQGNIDQQRHDNCPQLPVIHTDHSDAADGVNSAANCNDWCQSTGNANRVKQRKCRNQAASMSSLHRLDALIRKNYLISLRNIGIFLFIYLLPAFQATIFNVTLGHEPKDLKMAIVNDEVNSRQGQICNYTTDCSYSMLSCRYLRYVNKNIIQVPFENISDAMEAGKNGRVWGVVHFGHNFTEEFELRQTEGDSATVENIMRSRISVNMDSSNQQIDVFIEKWLMEAFRDFLTNFMTSCQYEPEAGYIPIVFLDPVYGKKDTSFTEFMAPGLIISIVYFMAVSLTAGVFVAERKQGLLDRSLVAGVTMIEILAGHLFNMFTIIMGQTALVFVCMLVIFNIPCQGNLALAVFITCLQGFVGMCFGLLITTACDDEATALNLSQASFIPLLVMGGICWPIEGMPYYLRYIAYSMPVTYAIESLRSIFSRGWGIEEVDVYAGILISIAWIFVLLILSLIVVRTRKYSN
ncbi:ABC protein, subfamily ABCH [Daphnia magna]|uniref:ABC protein, subfamily ABCH n=1 Tax=Daphnia magna TaxID=35525 RepID=A0A0P5YGN3_9CRUS|nr:ABC protein, subfamily ABCH [Daphnia magna]